MRWLLLLLAPLLLFYGCSQRTSPEDQLVVNRMEWVNSLRASLDTAAWPGLADSAYNVPLVYFSDSASWIANPTPGFLQQHPASLTWEGPSLKVYKTYKRLNELPFQMNTGMDIADESAHNYYHPFIYSSSPEETRKTIPDVRSTEEWASMMLHEYFHGFQFRHKALTDYYAKAILPLQADSLSRIYRNNAWFKEQLDQENELLLQALATDYHDSIKAVLSAFDSLRQSRRGRFQELYALNIGPYEDYYEKIEGSARYVEARLLHTYKFLPPDNKLLQTDTTYKSHLEYQNFSVEQEPWLYKSNKSGNYVYATGFNQLRLLDKLGIAYKAILFTQPEINLYTLLKSGFEPTLSSSAL